MPIGILQNVIMLNVILLTSIMPIVILQNAILLSVFILIAVMLNVVMLNINKLSVFRLSANAEACFNECHYFLRHDGECLYTLYLNAFCYAEH